MKYMQNGGFQKNSLMRLTLWLTLLFLAGFVFTNFLIYFDKMDFSPGSVVSYYNGSEENFRPARSYQSMLEVTHAHMAMMAFVLLLLTHLIIFAPFSKFRRVVFIVVAFGSALLNEASGWLVRFVSSDYAWLKVASFSTLQAVLIFLLASLAIFLLRSAREEQEKPATDAAPGSSAEEKTRNSEYLFSSEPDGKKERASETLST
ncbi:MAG: hypothetical protein ACRDGA_02290 [Bacteroidota bacterium]